MSAADPAFARYLIAPVIIDGPVLPLGEAEFRIIGTIAAPEGDACSCGMNPPADWRKICATCGGEDELLRFRVTDWAGPKPYERPSVEVTDRGFKHYEAIETDRGEKVRVYESSAAEGPHLWLSAEGEAHLEGPVRDHVGLPFGLAPATCAAHLTLDQARAVRDRLDAAICGHYQRASGTCGRVLVGRGSDTFDPCCVLPAGHEEPCKP